MNHFQSLFFFHAKNGQRKLSLICVQHSSGSSDLIPGNPIKPKKTNSKVYVEFGINRYPMCVSDATENQLFVLLRTDKEIPRTRNVTNMYVYTLPLIPDNSPSLCMASCTHCNLLKVQLSCYCRDVMNFIYGTRQDDSVRID